MPSRRTRLETSCIPLVLFLVLAGAAYATQVRPLDLERMTERAATIFSGRCTEVGVEVDPEFGAVTRATFSVDRSVKGDVGALFTLRMIGDAEVGTATGLEIAGLPRFRPGEEVVLFLYGVNARGLTSPVGLGQGKFTVERDKNGRAVVLSTLGDARLLGGLTTETRARLAPALARIEQDGALTPENLLDMARTLGETGGR